MLLPKRIWKDIENYEGLYQVSNLGEVRSIRNGKCRKLKVCEGAYKYLLIQLSKNGKATTYRVHRLVAQAFIPNPHNYEQVNHKDEDKQNNLASNLEWCNQVYNCNYGTFRKRVGVRAKKIRCITTGEIFNSQAEAEQKYGATNISNCCRHKRTYSGKHPVTKEKLKWEYVDE